MNLQERATFLQLIAEVAKLTKLAQIEVERARSLCHADTYELVDFMSKRLYELRVTSEWLQQRIRRAETGYLPIDPDNRLVSDRRTGIDRRIATMRKELLGIDVTGPMAKPVGQAKEPTDV